MHFFGRKTTPTSSYDENVISVAAKLIDSLRPMFAAHKDIGEARLDVILELFHDHEPDIALDSIMENLNDINFEAVSAPLSTEQADQIKALIHKLSSDDSVKQQKYLAIVDRITIAALPRK
jgi:putative lipoic acid-binding regulatory protein